MNAAAVKLGIPASATGKLIRFQLNLGPDVVSGIGVLNIRPESNGYYLVEITISQFAPQEITGEISHRLIVIHQRHADLIRKSPANLAYEYEMIETG